MLILRVTTEGKKAKEKRHLFQKSKIMRKLFEDKNLIEFFADLDR
jgi:hypothetical protein